MLAYGVGPTRSSCEYEIGFEIHVKKTSAATTSELAVVVVVIAFS
jgi:hypothetical protein